MLVRVNIVLMFQCFSFRGDNILHKWLEKYLFLHLSPFIKYENYTVLAYFPGVARVFIYPNLIVMCTKFG
jgi:hypothetical protein